MKALDRRRPAWRAIAGATCLAAVVAGGAGVSGVANADTRASDDAGGAAGAKAVLDHSQTPLQVRSGVAHLASAVERAQMLRLSIGLTSRDQAGQEKFNRDVQDRSSPLFHKYLTAAEWNARFSPSAANEQAVMTWAKASGLTVTHRFPNRLLVDVEGSAAALESAFKVKLNNYTYGAKSFFSNDREPVLPSNLTSVITSVDGLNDFASLKPASGRPTAPAPRYVAGPMFQKGPSAHANGSKTALKAAMAKQQLTNKPNITSGNYDPTDIYSSQAYDENALYGQVACCNPAHLGTGSPRETSIAIVTAGAHNTASDMAGFTSRYSYLAYNINEYYIGGTPTCCDFEGQMDIEWATALGNSFGSYLDTSHVYLYSGVNPQIATFNSMFNQILTNNTARIVSSSWGCAEITCYSDASMNTNNTIFNSMIAQGYTLVNASNDKGAHADCTSTDRVQYPASDPNWLAISATRLELGAGPSPVFQSEVAWPANSAGCANNGGGGGGGCSVKFAIPSWQSSPANPNHFCGNFKTVPDVSLNGDWFNSAQNIYFNGGWSGNGGTSIAAPEMAGFYAVQNTYLLTLGNKCGLGSGTAACSPIGQGGFNLYHAAISKAAGRNAFYDTTSGCTSNDAGPGFCAIVGYDRATGWGTVNFLQLAWAQNYWTIAEAGYPSVNLSGPSTSAWHSSGTISWTIADSGSSGYPASGVAGWTSRWDADPGNPLSHATPGTGDSFYSGPASAHGSTSGSTSIANGGAGCHTLYVRAWDNIGLSTVSSYPVCYDPTLPTVSAPSYSFITGGQIRATGNAPIRIAWSGSDSYSGINHYTLWKSVDGAAYTQLTLPTPTSTSVDLALAPGHSFQFAVSGFDNAGNWSGYKYSGLFNLNLYQQGNSAVAYSAGWTSQSFADASNGSVKYSNTAGRTATFTFTGKKVAWVSTRNTNRGTGNFKLDSGAAIATNTNGSYLPRLIVRAAPTVGTGTHHLVVTNQGTSGHPRIDVDAFLVIS